MSFITKPHPSFVQSVCVMLARICEVSDTTFTLPAMLSVEEITEKLNEQIRQKIGTRIGGVTECTFELTVLSDEVKSADGVYYDVFRAEMEARGCYFIINVEEYGNGELNLIQIYISQMGEEQALITMEREDEHRDIFGEISMYYSPKRIADRTDLPLTSIIDVFTFPGNAYTAPTAEMIKYTKMLIEAAVS